MCVKDLHLCTCSCHRLGGHHIVPCCITCNICNLDINRLYIAEHKIRHEKQAVYIRRP